jgi:choline-glycine betaine transporter
VFWALKSASPRKVTTTSPLSIILAATASLPPVAVLTACTIYCGVRFRSKSSDPASRTISSLARRAGTTTLGCHTASLLVVCAITAAQLRTIGSIAAEEGFGRFRKAVSITFFRFCLVIGALSLSLLPRFSSAKLSRSTFAYLSMALRPAFFLFSSNSPTISFTAFSKSSSLFFCDASSLRSRCSS